MSSPLKRRASGFTLLETLLAVSILAIATVGIMSFFIQGTKMYYSDRASLIINRDIRTFTAKLDTDAVTSNYFRIYPDFSTRVDSNGNDQSVVYGQVGDMAVFIYTDPSQTQYGISLITRLVGYYREVTNTTLNTGPVHRFDIDLSANPVNSLNINIGALLNQKVTGSASSYPIVTQIAQGLATSTTSSTPTPKLFYNFVNRSVMVAAQISESLNETQLSTSRTGNTYNFTISPRG